MRGSVGVGGAMLAGLLLTTAAGADRSQETAKGEEPLQRDDLGCLDPGQDPQKATMAAIRNLGTAYMSWVVDQSDLWPQEEMERLSAEAMAQWNALEPQKEGMSTWLRVPHEKLSRERLEAILIPSDELYYIREIPILDGWCRPFEIVGSPDNPFGPSVIAIRSAGANGAFEGPEYAIGTFAPGDAVDDIVWEDGFFVRWPESPRTERGE